MTRLADRIIGRIEDKAMFGLYYGNYVSIWFQYFPKNEQWDVTLYTRHARVSKKVDHLNSDCIARYICGPGFDANLEGAEIRGYWDGDTEEEKIEARGSEYVYEDEEDDE